MINPDERTLKKYVVEYTIPYGEGGRVIVPAFDESDAYSRVKGKKDPHNNNGIIIYHIGVAVDL